MEKECVQCGKVFQAKMERRQFCSDICRATFHQNIKTAKNKSETNKDVAELYSKLKVAMKDAPSIKQKKTPVALPEDEPEKEEVVSEDAKSQDKAEPPKHLKGLDLRIWWAEQGEKNK